MLLALHPVLAVVTESYYQPNGRNDRVGGEGFRPKCQVRMQMQKLYVLENMNEAALRLSPKAAIHYVSHQTAVAENLEPAESIPMATHNRKAQNWP